MPDEADGYAISQLADALHEVEKERDMALMRMRLLGDALGKVLVELGIANNIELTGPQLLMLADDAVEFLKKIDMSRYHGLGLLDDD